MRGIYQYSPPHGPNFPRKCDLESIHPASSLQKIPVCIESSMTANAQLLRSIYKVSITYFDALLLTLMRLSRRRIKIPGSSRRLTVASEHMREFQ